MEGKHEGNYILV